MSVANASKLGLRPEREESSRLLLAFVLSLILHLVVAGTYYGGKRLGVWDRISLPTWLHSPRLLTEVLKKNQAARKQAESEPPLVYVQVTPEQVTAEPPKNAKFYSDKNSQAANPNPNADTETPRIEGNQTKMVKTETVPQTKYVPLQPSKPLLLQPDHQVEQKARRDKTAGDLEMAKANPQPNDAAEDGTAAKSRPRTIKEALARLGNNRLPGEAMKQEGGVRRHLEISSLDARATPFGAYDAALVEAISQRWYSLLDERSYASDSIGKVVLQFSLHYDGRVTDMKVAENTAGEVLGLLCQKAILDPAPFAAWPSDMRRMIGEVRHIQFTFFYN